MVTLKAFKFFIFEDGNSSNDYFTKEKSAVIPNNIYWLLSTNYKATNKIQIDKKPYSTHLNKNEMRTHTIGKGKQVFRQK